jgi:hypothetical protein
MKYIFLLKRQIFDLHFLLCLWFMVYSTWKSFNRNSICQPSEQSVFSKITREGSKDRFSLGRSLEGAFFANTFYFLILPNNLKGKCLLFVQFISPLEHSFQNSEQLLSVEE